MPVVSMRANVGPIQDDTKQILQYKEPATYHGPQLMNVTQQSVI